MRTGIFELQQNNLVLLRSAHSVLCVIFKWLDEATQPTQHQRLQTTEQDSLVSTVPLVSPSVIQETQCHDDTL